MTTADDVCEFLELMSSHGIRVWLDGGWAADALVRFHTGYPVDGTDWADVSALCARFGLTVPSDYARFR